MKFSGVKFSFLKSWILGESRKGEKMHRGLMLAGAAAAGYGLSTYQTQDSTAGVPSISYKTAFVLAIALFAIAYFMHKRG